MSEDFDSNSTKHTGYGFARTSILEKRLRVVRRMNSLAIVPALDLGRRARAAGIHLMVSLVIAGLAAALVFGLWYPGPYRSLSGGRDLFLLITTVDVILGPLLTFVVFDLRKGWPHVRRDLAVIGCIQLAALVYGLHTVYVARPVAMVFEVDRFRVVTANDVHVPDLPEARPEYRNMPLSGPWLLGTRPVMAGDERNDALLLGLDGIDIGMRPKFWWPYEQSKANVLKVARPLGDLLKKYPERSDFIRQRLADRGEAEANVLFVPVLARGDWVVLIGTDASIIDFENVDGFF